MRARTQRQLPDTRHKLVRSTSFRSRLTPADRFRQPTRLQQRSAIRPGTRMTAHHNPRMRPAMFSSLRRRRITARHRQTTPRRTTRRRTSPRRLRSQILARRRTFHGRPLATATTPHRRMPGRPTQPAAVRITAGHVATARRRGHIRQAQAHMDHRQRPTALAEAIALRRRTRPVRMPLLRSTTRRPLLPTIPVGAVLRTTPAAAETAAADTPIRPADTAEATAANS